jgi:DNA invertase Pin-like site-specific DNA recombinase
LKLSNVGEIERQLNLFTKRHYSKKNYQHKLGAYVRLSPSVDDPRDEGSLKNHPLHIFNYVERKNSDKENWGQITEWYVDSEVSAATLDRPAFQRMLQDMNTGKINSFIVYDLLRASRDVGDFSQVLKFLQECRIRFFSTCDPIDLETPFGRFMA